MLFYRPMRGIPLNFAILLVACGLAVTGVASSAEARGARVSATAAKMSRGARIKLDRMKAKMGLRTKGLQREKPRRQIRLGKRQLQRAMSRRDMGLKTGETDRVRERFARSIDAPRFARTPRPSGSAGGKPSEPAQEEIEARSVAQRKKMRDSARRRAGKAFKKLRRRND